MAARQKSFGNEDVNAAICGNAVARNVWILASKTYRTGGTIR